MKALITGATGFTGSNLAKTMLKKGCQVKALVRKSSNYAELQQLGVELVFGDITDPSIVRQAVKGVNTVFHIAALFRTAGVPQKAYWEVNVAGTENVFRACTEEGPDRIVHCSTIGVHGHVKNPPANEQSPFNPGDIYQLTKLEGEKLAMEYTKKYKLPAVIIRPASIYGPGDLRFLKLFKTIAKKKFMMIGNGKTLLHPVYIEDLINGFILAAEKKDILGETFIIAGPEYLPLNELVKKIARILDVPCPKLRIPALPVQIAGSICEALCVPLGIEPPLYRRRVDFFTKTRAFSTANAKKKLGFNPKYDVDTGFRLTAEWYKEKGLL